jgi:hypothetical protein
MPSEAHVLLMPEDFSGSPPADHAVYGVVVSTEGTSATVGLLSPPHTTVRVGTSVVRARRVDTREHAAGAVGEWLRKAVVGVCDDVHVYGQVVGYNGSFVTITSADGDVTSSVDDLREVAPVICFLMAKSRFDATDTSADELQAHHVVILDRLMGPQVATQRTRGQPAMSRATRSIPKLLAGILPPRQHPSPADALNWVNAETGTVSMVGCRHAVDFAHYVDGGRPIPASIQPDIGASFDDDPRYATEAVESAEEEDEATAEATLRHALLDPVDLSNTTTGRAEPVQDPLAQLEALLDAVGPAPMPTVPAPTARDVAVSPPPLGDGKHIMILAAIADRPDLVRAYLSMCQQANGKRPSQASEERPAQRRRYETPSDVIDLTEYQERRSKHAFTPTRVQQAIYGVLSSAAYKGKDAVAIVEAMISSRSTKFKPIPAIIIRIYAFEFGARGLSIMHFCRFDFAARRLWYASASVNFNNFSASVTLPKATRPSSLDQVSNALTVLHLFVEEFMDVETCRLVSSSREFIEELRGFCQWGERDVQTLTFWFDSVFESFRSAAEYDSRCGTSSRSQIRNKLSLQDPDLQSVLYVIQSERLASMMPAHG